MTLVVKGNVSLLYLKANMRMLLSQKNALFDAIVQIGLNPNDFTFEEEQIPGEDVDTWQTAIRSNGTPYYFICSGNWIEFSPALDDIKNSFVTSHWVAKSVAFSEWLTYLKREVTQPDKWAELYSAQEGVKVEITDAVNTPFSYQEVIEIQTAMQQLKTRLESVCLIPEQLKLIHDRLDYLQEKAKTFGRIDWKNLMLGTMLNTLVTLALTPETAKAVWVVIKEVLQKVVIIQLQ